MKSSFQDRDFLYLAMEYLRGGDLRFHLCFHESLSESQTSTFIFDRRVPCRMHRSGVGVHPLKKHHPPRSEALKPRLRAQWIPAYHWLRGGPSSQGQQLWRNQWNSRLHGTRSHLQDEPCLRSRLLCSWSDRLWDPVRWGTPSNISATIPGRLSQIDSIEDPRQTSQNCFRRPSEPMEFWLHRFC